MKSLTCKYSENHSCDETCQSECRVMLTIKPNVEWADASMHSSANPIAGSEALVVQMLPIIDQVKTGEEIRKRRCQAMLSLREVAKAMGWSAAYQSDLELGRKRWTEKKCLEVESAIFRLSISKP